jgi:hypothetical protein
VRRRNNFKPVKVTNKLLHIFNPVQALNTRQRRNGKEAWTVQQHACKRQAIFCEYQFKWKLYAQSRMASLSQRHCFRFFEKNCLRIFFNHAFGVTEPKEVPFAITGVNIELQALFALKLNLVVCLDRSQEIFYLTTMRTMKA